MRLETAGIIRHETSVGSLAPDFKCSAEPEKEKIFNIHSFLLSCGFFEINSTICRLVNFLISLTISAILLFFALTIRCT